MILSILQSSTLPYDFERQAERPERVDGGPSFIMRKSPAVAGNPSFVPQHRLVDVRYKQTLAISKKPIWPLRFAYCR